MPATSVVHPVLFKDESSRKGETERKEGRKTENPETKEPKYDWEQLLLPADLCRAIMIEKATCLILSCENPFFTVNLHLNQFPSA